MTFPNEIREYNSHLKASVSIMFLSVLVFNVFAGDVRE